MVKHLKCAITQVLIVMLVVQLHVMILVEGRKNENLTKTFVSSIFYKGKSIHLGYFNDPLVAHLSYKVKKEELLKIYAEELVGTIDDRAYNALINYKVEITD